MAASEETDDLQQAINLLDKFPNSDDMISLCSTRTWCIVTILVVCDLQKPSA